MIGFALRILALLLMDVECSSVSDITLTGSDSLSIKLSNYFDIRGMIDPQISSNIKKISIWQPFQLDRIVDMLDVTPAPRGCAASSTKEFIGSIFICDPKLILFIRAPDSEDVLHMSLPDELFSRSLECYTTEILTYRKAAIMCKGTPFGRDNVFDNFDNPNTLGIPDSLVLLIIDLNDSLALGDSYFIRFEDYTYFTTDAKVVSLVSDPFNPSNITLPIDIAIYGRRIADQQEIASSWVQVLTLPKNSTQFEIKTTNTFTIVGLITTIQLVTSRTALLEEFRIVSTYFAKDSALFNYLMANVSFIEDEGEKKLSVSYGVQSSRTLPPSNIVTNLFLEDARFIEIQINEALTNNTFTIVISTYVAMNDYFKLAPMKIFSYQILSSEESFIVNYSYSSRLSIAVIQTPGECITAIVIDKSIGTSTIKTLELNSYPSVWSSEFIILNSDSKKVEIYSSGDGEIMFSNFNAGDPYFYSEFSIAYKLTNDTSLVTFSVEGEYIPNIREYVAATQTDRFGIYSCMFTNKLLMNWAEIKGVGISIEGADQETRDILDLSKIKRTFIALNGDIDSVIDFMAKQNHVVVLGKQENSKLTYLNLYIVGHYNSEAIECTQVDTIDSFDNDNIVLSSMMSDPYFVLMAVWQPGIFSVYGSFGPNNITSNVRFQILGLKAASSLFVEREKYISVLAISDMVSKVYFVRFDAENLSSFKIIQTIDSIPQVQGSFIPDEILMHEEYSNMIYLTLRTKPLNPRVTSTIFSFAAIRVMDDDISITEFTQIPQEFVERKISQICKFYADTFLDYGESIEGYLHNSAFASSFDLSITEIKGTFDKGFCFPKIGVYLRIFYEIKGQTMTVAVYKTGQSLHADSRVYLVKTLDTIYQDYSLITRDGQIYIVTIQNDAKVLNSFILIYPQPENTISQVLPCQNSQMTLKVSNQQTSLDIKFNGVFEGFLEKASIAHINGFERTSNVTGKSYSLTEFASVDGPIFQVALADNSSNCTDNYFLNHTQIIANVKESSEVRDNFNSMAHSMSIGGVLITIYSDLDRTDIYKFDIGTLTLQSVYSLNQEEKARNCSKVFYFVFKNNGEGVILLCNYEARSYVVFTNINDDPGKMIPFIYSPKETIDSILYIEDESEVFSGVLITESKIEGLITVYTVILGFQDNLGTIVSIYEITKIRKSI